MASSKFDPFCSEEYEIVPVYDRYHRHQGKRVVVLEECDCSMSKYLRSPLSFDQMPLSDQEAILNPPYKCKCTKNYVPDFRAFMLTSSSQYEELPVYADWEDNLQCSVPVSPFTGVVNLLDFQKILEILYQEISSDSEFWPKYSGRFSTLAFAQTPDSVREFLDKLIILMSERNLATVEKKISRKKRLDLKKRVCYRKSFGKNVIKQLEKVILPAVRVAAKKFSVPPENIRIEPSHGDVLLYREGGKFEYHTDRVAEFPFAGSAIGWRQHSMILCLDANIRGMNFVGKGELVDDGNTKVCLPSKSFPIFCENSQIERYYSESDYRRKLIQHTFSQSCIPRNFLVFSSEAFHSSVRISQKDGYKLALKLDLWIKKPRLLVTPLELKTQYREEIFESLTDPKTPISKLYARISATPNCSCKLCDKKQSISACAAALHFFPLPYVITNLIAEFVIDNSKRKNDCICDGPTFLVNPCCCTCAKCFLTRECTNDHYSHEGYDSPDYDDDDDCNGWED